MTVQIYAIKKASRRRLTAVIAGIAAVSAAAAVWFLSADEELRSSTARAAVDGKPFRVELLDTERNRNLDGLLDRAVNAIPGTDVPSETEGEAGERLVETVIKPGDTLAKALGAAGADNVQAHLAATSLGKLTDLRRLKPGQELTLWFDRATDTLTGVQLKESVERTVLTRADAEGNFTASEEKTVFEQQTVKAKGVIDDSLFLAAGRAGLEHQVTAELIRMFSFDVDFQRGIHPGDSFELTYERFLDDDGKVQKTGRILKATLNRQGKPLTYYRFHPKGETWPGYFDARGQSAKKTLMQTPIDGARISSGYGRRRHPILGYTKMHKGVDFAARSGTPIMAAGDGVIESIGWNGGYGRYIRIRHNGTYKTAYAHMRGFRSGLKRGAQVKQGQIIGYVGTSGRSTGPHLHYEVHKDGRQVNPRSIKLPTGIKLSGKQLAAFEAHRDKIDQQIANMPWLAEPEVATSGETPAGD